MIAESDLLESKNQICNTSNEQMSSPNDVFKHFEVSDESTVAKVHTQPVEQPIENLDFLDDFQNIQVRNNRIFY